MVGKPPELWAFVLANIGLFVISSLLMGLSYLAYRQYDGESAYLLATVGFGSVVLGGLVEPVYQLGVRGDAVLNRTELLYLQSGETFFIAIGLGLLFYAIVRRDAGASGSDGPESSDEDGYLLDRTYGD